MTFSLQLERTLHFESYNTVKSLLVPSSSTLFIVPPVRSADLLKSSSDRSGKQLWRRKPHHRLVCNQNILASSPCYVGLTTRRRPRRGQILCSTAASISSTPSSSETKLEQQQQQQQFVNLLGREFLQRDVQIVCTGMATILLSISNKIFYKMALIPLKRHPLFLAQLNTIAYVVVYSTILYVRHRTGIITKEMLAFPKARFVLTGALEAFAISMGMAAAAMLPGASIPILTQVFLVWQLILSSTILKKRYTFGQLGGCLLVISGVVVVVASGSGGVGATPLQQLGYFWPLLMIASTLFSAAASIVKESVFQDAIKNVKGGNLDLFVVNTFGSIFQALFVFAILPFVFNAQGIPVHEIPRHLKDGCVCLVNVGSTVEGCQGAPLVPLLYVVVNICCSVCTLSLLKQSSAIVSSLCVTLSIPLSIWAFTFPWPYLGTPSRLPPGLLLGAGILIAGLALYSLSSSPKKKKCKM